MNDLRFQSLSPYVEPPSIPEGVTVGDYRRARPRQTKPRLGHLRRWLRHRRGAEA
jgi:hypothetical protein